MSVAAVESRKGLTSIVTCILALTCMIFSNVLNAYTISSEHPRLLVTPEDVFRIRNEHIIDGNMEDVDCTYWEDQLTPTLKEKITFDGDQRLHVSAPSGSGARQYFYFEPGVEYEYSVDVYVTSGTCSGKLYQSAGSAKTIFVSTTAQWQTFTGTFVATGTNPLCIMFRAIVTNGEFYIDNVSFKPTYERVADKDMESVDCSEWQDEGSPTTKEKYDFDGSKRLHIVGDSGTGAKQSLISKPGIEYEYSVDVYVVVGSCSGQFYQYDNALTIFSTSTSGQWQTFTGTFATNKAPLLLRFRSLASGAEFYIDNVSLKPTHERINDGTMINPDCYSWQDEGSPTLKEKAVLGNDRRLHISGSSGTGARQIVYFKPGVTYEYSADVYVVNGTCSGRLYQYGNALTFFATSTSGQWQTFTGTFVPSDAQLTLLFRAIGGDAEFYIDNVSFKPANNVDDNCPRIHLGPLYEYASQLENDGTPNPSVTEVTSSASIVEQVRSMAFVGMISREERFIDLAIDYALAIADKDPSIPEGDGEQRERILSMAFVYDWLNDELSSSEKETLRASMVAHIQYLGAYLSPTLYTGGHGRYGNTTFLGALLAMHGEYGTYETYCTSALASVVSNWEDGFNPFQAWVSAEGGSQMGWSYGAAYRDVNPYLFWESAADETWGESWREAGAYFWIYGIRGDGTFPPISDAGITGYANDSSAVCLISAALGNSYAANFVDMEGLGSIGSEYIWRIIYMNSHDTEIDYDEISTLDKAREFGNSGFVIAKDKWNDTETTQLVFKCSSFYSRAHHHKDQNSISLHYKGPLLIDSGSYDGFGSTHYKNYYSRTIAHNSMVVYDASEHFYWDSSYNEVANDGGQKFAAYLTTPVGVDPYDLDDILNYSKFQIDGITSFSQTSTQCYMKGDASLAYSSDKLDTYTREVTMVYEDQNNNNQPTLNVKDHIVLNKTLTPRILFHSELEPEVDPNGQWVKIENSNGGGVKIELVAPTGAVITKIGGTGYEFMVNGTNYTPTEYTPTEVGAWRVEISTSTAVTSADFEFNLKIYDVP